MPQEKTESLASMIYRRFLEELEVEDSLAPEERAAVRRAVSAGTIGSETTVREIIETMGAVSDKNIKP